MAIAAGDDRRARILLSKKTLLSSSSPGILWLVGSPLFLPPLTVAAALRCIHSQPDGDPFSPDFAREAGEISALLIRGFDIIGALFVGSPNNEEAASRKALDFSSELRKHIFGGNGNHDMLGATASVEAEDIKFYVSDTSPSRGVKLCDVIFEASPHACLWEKSCLLRCDLSLKFPLYVSQGGNIDTIGMFSSMVDSAAAKLRDPHVAFLVEGSNGDLVEAPHPVVLHGKELDFTSNMSSETPFTVSQMKSSSNNVTCSHFCATSQCNNSAGREFVFSPDTIQVIVLSNHSMSCLQNNAPIVEYLPAPEPVKILTVSMKLDVLCYASRDFPLGAAISMLLVPGLVDQLNTMKKAVMQELLVNHPQLKWEQLAARPLPHFHCGPQLFPYHYLPAGMLIPVTAIYDLRYGEMEDTQGKLRKSMHLRLGLPLDRPLLRISNALNFGRKDSREKSLTRDGSPLLRDVHTEIPSSGVSGGLVSLIDGSYEYYHYLHDGIDDNGWGCAYRSLQTIISWYKLQQYTSVEVPSHREIQQALVEIGDKEPSFVGSREWIGAIELSFVLDKLIGVSCKVINVRSGEDLPEKCRELAMHFETQGTPIMIGGGVLAYTLLGVDFNDASGDCAFLILDPHYTGADDIKKVVSGGWCGWKKAVDSKGKSFFLKDKFYNLLLPQRPNMV